MRIMIILLLLMATGVNADYYIDWYTMDAGGNTSADGSYLLNGTVAQPDACRMAAGNYKLTGGFWPTNPVCIVNLDDFARFAEYWLEVGTGLPADLYEDNVIDVLDLSILVDHWLYYCPWNWPLAY